MREKVGSCIRFLPSGSTTKCKNYDLCWKGGKFEKAADVKCRPVLKRGR